eukprot:9472813-Pyramimonas_sp.AAC.1
MSPVLAILSLEYAPCKFCKVFANHLHHTASLAAGGTLAPPKLSGLILQVGSSARPAAGWSGAHTRPRTAKASCSSVCIYCFHTWLASPCDPKLAMS